MQQSPVRLSFLALIALAGHLVAPAEARAAQAPLYAAALRPLLVAQMDSQSFMGFRPTDGATISVFTNLPLSPSGKGTADALTQTIVKQLFTQ